MRFVFERMKLKEVQVKDGTWFVQYWRRRCPRCTAKVEAEGAAYCPNCGKWLGKIRTHVLGMAAIAFFFCILPPLMAAGLDYVWECPGMNYPLAACMVGVGLLTLLGIKPVGKYLVWLEDKRRRAREWNAKMELEEIDRRQEERERSEKAKARSGVNVVIDTGSLKKTTEMLRNSVKEIARACKPPHPFSKKYPLFDAGGAYRRELGTITMTEPSRLRECIRSGAKLILERHTGGSFLGFHLQPLHPTNEGDFQRPTICAQLPVRNAAALEVMFLDYPDRVESFKDIKRNLENAYDWRRMLGEILSMWTGYRPNCARCGPLTPEECSDCDTAERALCEAMYQTRKELGLPVDKVKLCRLMFRGEGCGLKDLLPGRNPSCKKTIEACRNHGNEERFSP